VGFSFFACFLIQICYNEIMKTFKILDMFTGAVVYHLQARTIRSAIRIFYRLQTVATYNYPLVTAVEV
jgi:hypothetical protein